MAMDVAGFYMQGGRGVALACEYTMYLCEVCSYRTCYEDYLIAHYTSCHFYCPSCRLVFRDDESRRKHYLKSYFHNHCEICDRNFQSPGALKGHLETHEKRNVRCAKCNPGFPSMSAMTKHVELGKCYGPLPQPQFVKNIRDWEGKTGNPNLFTVPRLGDGDNNASFGSVRASAATYNGNAFECYFCVREFSSLVSLNQHLNSGVHFTTKEFRCQKCAFTATWLSGLIAHIESEKCGFMKLSQVRDMATPFSQLRIGN